MGLTDNPDFYRYTPLCLEMKIAYECLHITHEKYLKLSAVERVKGIIYEQMEQRRAQFIEREKIQQLVRGMPQQGSGVQRQIPKVRGE